MNGRAETQLETQILAIYDKLPLAGKCYDNLRLPYS